MKIYEALKSFLRQFEAFIVAMVLGLLAFGMGHYASAAEQDLLVNSKIKEEFIRIDVEQRRAALEYNRPSRETLTEANNPAQPLSESDPLLK